MPDRLEGFLHIVGIITCVLAVVGGSAAVGYWIALH